MYLLGLGLVFLALKLMELGPVANWSWVSVLCPFGLAVLWWLWADFSGYTKRVQMDKIEKRRQARIDKNRSALGGRRRR